MSFAAKDHNEILHTLDVWHKAKMLVKILTDVSLLVRAFFLYSNVHTLFLRLAVKRTWESCYCGFTTLSTTFGIVQGHVEEMWHC